jgi:hypothetical protein
MNYRKQIDWVSVEKLARAGGTWKSISQDVGISFTCLKTRSKADKIEIYTIIRNNGLSRWGGHNRKIDVERAVEMRRRGMTFSKIGAMFGTDFSSASRAIKRRMEATNDKTL